MDGTGETNLSIYRKKEIEINRKRERGRAEKGEKQVGGKRGKKMEEDMKKLMKRNQQEKA